MAASIILCIRIGHSAIDQLCRAWTQIAKTWWTVSRMKCPKPTNRTQRCWRAFWRVKTHWRCLQKLVHLHLTSKKSVWSRRPSSRANQVWQLQPQAVRIKWPSCSTSTLSTRRKVALGKSTMSSGPSSSLITWRLQRRSLPAHSSFSSTWSNSCKPSTLN